MQERMGVSAHGGGTRPPFVRRLGSALLCLLLASIVALLSAAPGTAEGATIQAAGGGYGGYYWQPSSAEVGTGGAVTFTNATAVPHDVTWTSGPGVPGCAGVPSNGAKSNWSGSCTFANPGTYAFVCSVHPGEMKGAITASAGQTPTAPLPTESPESPRSGAVSRALKLDKVQRGRRVRGSIGLSQAGAGARLRVDVFATRASLFGRGRSGRARVGRLVRSSLLAGRVSFKVSLRGAALRALSRRGRLRLTVKTVLIPPQGDRLKFTRKVVLRV